MTQPKPVRPALVMLVVSLLVILAVLGVVAIGIGANLMFRNMPELIGWLTSTTTVTFRAQAGDKTVTAADLENAARILTDRAKKAGYGSASFAATPGGQIAGRVPTRLDAAALSRLTGIGLVELVDLGQNPLSPGTLIRTDLPSLAPQMGEGPVWHTVMSNDSFKSASVGRASTGEWVVYFTLTEEGTKTLADFTTQHVGTTLGIALDKQIISSPKVQAPIPDGRGQIWGRYTEDDAQNLAAIITTEPMPVRLEPAVP